MKKILVVANADSPYSHQTVRMACESSFEIIWYSESYSTPDPVCRIFHYHKLKFLGPVNKIFGGIYFLWVYHKTKPDILHIHWALFFPLVFRKKWRNLIISVMGSDVNLPGKLGIRKLFARIGLDHASLITSKSTGMDAAIQALGDYAEKIRRVTWGVDDQLFTAKSRQRASRCFYGINQTAFVAFSPRAMQPLYRIPAIVESFLEYAKTDDNCYLIMAGMNADESVVQQVNELIKSSHLRSHIIQLPKLSKTEMTNCYAASDVMLSYATSDGMPHSLYEGMAVGCFPIFTDLSCYSEILRHNENAFLCSTNEPSSIRQALIDYHQKFSQPEIEKIILDNREYIKNTALRSTQVKRLENIYHEIS